MDQTISCSMENLLIESIEKCDIPTFDYCLENIKNINYQDETDGNSPLMYVILSMSVFVNDNEEVLLNYMIDKILNHPTNNINIVNNCGNTALHLACLFQNMRIVIKLLNYKNIDLSLKNQDKLTAELCAKQTRATHIQSILREHRLNQNKLHRELFFATSKGRLDCMLKICKKCRVDAHLFRFDKNFSHYIGKKKYSFFDNSLLHVSAFYGNVHIMKFLIEHGADINDQCFTGNTPIIMAIVSNKFSAVKYLIQNGADINLKGCNGWSPLHFAARRNLNLIVNILLHNKCKINVLDSFHQIPLNYCSLKTGKKIIDNMIDVEEKNEDGYTILHQVIICKLNVFLQHLMSKKPSLYTKTNYGYNCLELALFSNPPELNVVDFWVKKKHFDVNSVKIGDYKYIDYILRMSMISKPKLSEKYLSCLANGYKFINKQNLKDLIIKNGNFFLKLKDMTKQSNKYEQEIIKSISAKKIKNTV